MQLKHSGMKLLNSGNLFDFNIKQRDQSKIDFNPMALYLIVFLMNSFVMDLFVPNVSFDGWTR